MIISAVIPARLASLRLPRKVLADINGRPLLWHVWQRVQEARNLDEILVVTDSPEVCSAVESWGGQALMTSPDCRSGTERIASTLDRIRGQFILNVQGDEPLIDPKLLERVAAAGREGGSDIFTAVYRIKEEADLLNPNVVKAVIAGDGRALYFSRSPIPYVRDLPPERWLEQQTFWGHIGVYGFRRTVLEAYFSLMESALEKAEKLEQLRFLEAGLRIQTIETDYHPCSVDTYADLERVRQILGQQI